MELEATTLMVDKFTKAIVDRIQQHVYGFDEKKIEEVIGQLLVENNETISTAESCTGGTIASTLSSIAGSSAYYLGSFVTYSYELKTQELGVKQNTLEQFGAVSAECVEEMLEGLLLKTKSTYGIAVSGIAGPSGGTDDKPVGTVYISVGDKYTKYTKRYQFTDNRSDNIIYSTNMALYMIYTHLTKKRN
jgi:nicotinamide-nucleotide amidase